jgi:hypothetical protein
VGQEPSAEAELAETRRAISAQRTDMERTADQLRDALDVRKRFRENPALFVGIGAGAVFLFVGGPARVARLVRRRAFPSNPEKAYDSLPKPMQAWVDHMAGAVGPRAAEARETLAHELVRWRHDPRKHGKVSKKLAKQIAEGPPGPKRAAWSAFEAGAAIVMAALARKAVERFLSGEPPSGIAPLDAAGTAGGATEPDPRHAKDDVTKPPEERAAAARAEYSGLSSRDRG